MAAEAKRACCFCIESPSLLDLGTVCSPFNSASSTFPVTLSDTNCLTDQQLSSLQIVCMYFGHPILLCPLIFIYSLLISVD